MRNYLSHSREDKNLYLGVALIFLLHLVILPWAQVVDADAVSRIFLAEDWSRHPEFITEGIWPPFHQYLNGIIIGITGDRIWSPIIVSMFLSSLTIIPVYRFTAREISKSGAWFAALFVVLSPVLFRNSFHTLSGTPFILCSALALNWFSRALQSGELKYAVYAGLAITFAAGFRYEAWLLIALLTGIGVLLKSIKTTFIFWLVAMIFPTFWMVGNYLAHGDWFYGVQGAYQWNVVLEGVNDYVSSEIKWVRWLYFPFSWFVNFSPILGVWMLIVLIRRGKRKQYTFSRFIWSLPFWIFMVVFMYKASQGTLLLQHRFTSTLILFSAPFTAYLVEGIVWSKLKGAVVLITLIPLSYFWMTLPFGNWFTKDSLFQSIARDLRTSSIASIPAIPRLKDQHTLEIADALRNNVSQGDGLIIDFLSWERTAFITLHSGIDHANMHYAHGARNAPQYIGLLEKKIEKCPKGVLIIKCNSPFSKYFNFDDDLVSIEGKKNYTLRVDSIYSYQKYIHMFRYELVNEHSVVEDKCDFCPTLNTRDYYRAKVLDDLNEMNKAVRMSYDHNEPIDSVIEKMTNWFIENQVSNSD